MKINIIYAISLLFILVACQKDKSEAIIQNPTEIRSEFSQLLDDYYDGSMALDPLTATSAGDSRFNGVFPNYLSKTYKDSSIAFYTRFKSKAEKVEDKYLSANESMSRAVLLWDCDINLQRLKFRGELFPVDQMWSRNLIMGQYASGTSAQPFNTVEDYETWLKRLDGFVIWLQTAEQRMKEGASIRYILPSSLILKVVPQLKAMTNENIDQHLFYTPVKNFPESFSMEDKERLEQAYSNMLKEKLIPAFTSLHNYVSTEYLEAGRNSSGIDAIPNGKELYQFAIKRYTTTNLSAQEIHQIGLDEVARILSEMEKVKEEVGFEGDIMAFFDHVRENKKLMPFTSPQEVIENFNKIHLKMQPRLKELFSEAPKTGFIVKRTETFREASASAEYNLGSLKDNRPGIFYVPIPDATQYNTYSDESLFLHEAIPGHHYQIALSQENDSLPKFRKILWYSAYGEGWALYAESLGKELGLYTDPYQYFGTLSAEMHRAIRLVVDTGLHSKGWTREQAIQYSLENEAESKASITSEIERYMANPGQALSYKIGQLKIIELRNRASQALGTDFDIKEFHHVVLQTGCIPLALLEDQINHWIQSKIKV
jgi:uncharacterized protein (DUF885 family)